MGGRRRFIAHTGLGILGAACGDDDGGVEPDGSLDAALDGADASEDMALEATMDAGVDMAEPDMAMLEPAPVPTIPFGFGFGVASGDPLPNAVIVWTRYLPEDGEALSVQWEVSETSTFDTLAASGEAMAAPERDFTVKVDVMGLRPGTVYFYRFVRDAEQSLVGRARTAAATADSVRFGVVSCSNYARGYFHVYRHLAERNDLDAVLHLGDYIYEYGDRPADLRLSDPPVEIVDLDAYRRRYQLYRLDPDLQALHQQHTTISVWDDHESANDAWRDGAENHTPDEGEWAARRSASVQAYFEWMPIREIDGDRVWRRFDFAGLVRLLMLDTRLWGRDEQPEPGDENEARSLLGDDQEAWLLEQLEGDGPAWKVLGQQVMFGHWNGPGRGGTFVPFNLDQWDGYRQVRARLFDAFESAGDVVVLTGDIHSHWALELTRDPNDPEVYDPATSRGSVGVEFVTSAVTSSGVPGAGSALTDILFDNNPHMRYINLSLRGYTLVDVTAARTQTDYVVIDGIGPFQGEQTVERSFTVAAGETRLEEATPLVEGPSVEPAPNTPARGHLPEG
ncbi:MAG: alkaline phosphatase D family protein [Myxococcota bacterium]